MAVIYNAKTGKEIPLELESRVVLYLDGAEFSGTEFEPVDVVGADDYSRISFRNTMRVDGSMQPGDYVLLLQVRDKQAKDKQNLAARTLGLRVAAP